jgi:hypothetical protein
MTYSKKRLVNGRLANRLPSRFIEEIDSKHFQRFLQGARPVSAENRKKMLAELIQKL